MTLTWGFVLICILAVIVAALIFWLIEAKLFPEDPVLRKWARMIFAIICVILLIIFLVNLLGGHVNMNTPIIRS